MTSKDIELNLLKLAENINENDFIFDFLMACGISPNSVARVRKGNYNLSKIDGEVLYKNKLFFKAGKKGELLADIDRFSKEDRIIKENPRFVIVTDFETLLAKDMRYGHGLDIAIEDLGKHYDFFLPIAGGEIYKTSNNNKADRDASYKMAELYDILVQDNPDIYKDGSHKLNVFLSRLLFCFFAEDTLIFPEKGMFTNALVQHTLSSGSDVNTFLNDLFKRLNTKDESAFPNFLQKFPFVNGGLFRDTIASPVFSSKARKILVECGDLDWSEINPDIFGSMIQAVVVPEQRSDFGMHYTSVPNIKKLIEPLFLDDLYAEFDKHKDNTRKLRELISRISQIKFFDPACGSGNFLIITYKEIRLLEIKILQRIHELKKKDEVDTFEFTSITLSQFYGIEIDDFAHEMAILSLWLAEHQMNLVFEEMLTDYGRSKPLLPLKEAGKIVCANAVRTNWETVCPKNLTDEIYIIGNPPYLGSRNQDEEQKEDLKAVFKTNYKSLDYVAAWFYKGAKYIDGYNAQLAFVSTNSINQGLLVELIWPRVLGDSLEIGFAYQSFKWTNNAKGNAGVTVVIVGLRNKSAKPKYLFTEKIKKEAKNINAYLLDGSDVIVSVKNQPISAFPPMNFGNMPADGGYLLFDEQEKKEFLLHEPSAEKWIKELISAQEFLNGKKRYCLWLEDILEEELNALPMVKERVNLVYKERLKSSRPQLAKVPHLFAQITQPADQNFILIPSTTSENRDYIPIGFFDKNFASHNSCMIVATDNSWLFGILHSKMHMVWVKNVGGKLETRYRYSAKLCYNTFPFPTLTEKQKETINQYVFPILEERAKYPQKTMAWLYNPDTMPAGLKKAHAELDFAIEQIYRYAPFNSDTERLEYLFKLYTDMTTKDTLFAKQKKTRKKA